MDLIPWLGIPVYCGLTVKGVLVARSLQEDAFAEEIEVIEAFADWSVLAVAHLETGDAGPPPVEL